MPVVDPKHVGDQEPITRYLFSKGDFSASGARPPAFNLPSNREYSVMRTEGLDDRQNWQLGVEEVGMKRPEKKPPKARIDFLANDLRTLKFPDGEFLKLEVHPDPSTHERHALILDWPEEEDMLEVKIVLAETIGKKLSKFPK